MFHETNPLIVNPGRMDTDRASRAVGSGGGASLVRAALSRRDAQPQFHGRPDRYRGAGTHTALADCRSVSKSVLPPCNSTSKG